MSVLDLVRFNYCPRCGRQQWEELNITIYGTNDGLATPEKIQASRDLLPPWTSWVAIEGGNHAQFGWYGPQKGDNPATLSHADQQAQVIAATLELLSAVVGNN